MCFFYRNSKEESLKLTDGSNFKNLLRNHQFYACTFGLNAAAEVINYLLKEKPSEGVNGKKSRVKN